MRVGVGIKTWMKSSLSRICTDVILSPSGFFIQLLLGISMVLVLLIRIGNWEPHWFLGIILWFERFSEGPVSTRCRLLRHLAMGSNLTRGYFYERKMVTLNQKTF